MSQPSHSRLGEPGRLTDGCVFKWVNIKKFSSEHTGILPKYVIVANIKRKYFPFIFIALSVRTYVCVTKVSKPSDTYMNICLQIAGYILESTSSYPSPFATTIAYPFDISFKPPFSSQFLRHIQFNVFDPPFQISAVFQNRTFYLFCFIASHMNYLR